MFVQSGVGGGGGEGRGAVGAGPGQAPGSLQVPGTRQLCLPHQVGEEHPTE